MLIIGFLLGLWRAVRAGRRAGIAPERVADTALVVLISGIVGARALYLLLQVPRDGWRVFAEFPRIWEGGLSFHGGLIAAVAAGAIYLRAKKTPFLRMADVMAPSAAIAYAFARVGCFLNGCCYGTASNLPWAVNFCDPTTHSVTGPRHPAQLYASAASMVIFVILTRIERLHRPAGFVFFWYLFLYSVYRFAIEFVRRGATADVWLFGLTQAQVVSVVGIATCAAVLWRWPRRTRGVQGDPGEA
jgi:phosphatidylglycerol:prolipoprotein diacylglycerol transferase